MYSLPRFALPVGGRKAVWVEQPGSLMVRARRGSGKTAVLKTLAVTARERRWMVEVLTANPSEWERWQMLGWYETASVRRAHALARLVEQRRYGREGGTPILLVIDHLDHIAMWDEEARAALCWLAQRGHEGQLMVAAAWDGAHSRATWWRRTWSGIWGEPVTYLADAFSARCAMTAEMWMPRRQRWMLDTGLVRQTMEV